MLIVRDDSLALLTEAPNRGLFTVLVDVGDFQAVIGGQANLRD